MSDQEWAIGREPGPIVCVAEAVPALESLAPRELKKARAGEPFHFAIDVVIEPTTSHGKRAYVASPVPGGLSWEIHCDEGKSIGGDEAAPAPLYYFVAGVGFCLLTHITGFLRFTKLRVQGIKVEIRGAFNSTLGHVHTGGQGEGGGDAFETHVILDSDEPPEKLRELVEICERACIAGQTIAHAVPTSVNVVVNGVHVAA